MRWTGRIGAALGAIALAVFPSLAPAGSFTCGGCAQEYTQAANFGILFSKVRQQVDIVRKLYESYLLEVSRLQEQVRSGLGMTHLSVADVLRLQQDLDAYQVALKALGQDVKGLATLFDTRMTEARLLNLSLDDYLKREAARIAAGSSAAKVRVGREVRLVDEVRADIEQVSIWGRRISATVGVHGSSQLFNSQLNMMAMQLTRLVALTAERQGSAKAEADMRKEEDRQAQLRVLDELSRSQAATDHRNGVLLKALERP